MAKRTNHNELTPEKIEAVVDEFGQKLEILRIRYEQYFIGVERMPPTVMRTEVVRLMRRLEQLKIRNTSLKFKLNSNVQKFNSYSSYWNRTMREIEDGTYLRHKQKVQRKNQRLEEQQRTRPRSAAQAESTEERETSANAPPEDKAPSEVAQEADAFLQTLNIPNIIKRSPAAVSKPATPKPAQRGPRIIGARPESEQPQTPRRPSIVGAKPRINPPAPAPKDGVQKLYDELNSTRQRLGLAPQSMEIDRFRQSIEAQSQKLKNLHQAKSVDYEVIIKDNMPLIKPIIKKK